MNGGLEAPVQKNQVVGTLQVRIGDKIIETVNIITMKQIDKKSLMHYFFDMLSSYNAMMTFPNKPVFLK